MPSEDAKHDNTSVLESMRAPNVLLVAKEDEKKLQFLKSDHKTTAPPMSDDT